MEGRVVKRFFIFFAVLTSINARAQCPNIPEICNNGVDDDCDGLIDCFDDNCSNESSCSDFYFGRDSVSCQVAPPVVTGYNLVEVWRSDVSVETRGTPIVGDLNGDGIPEVVTHFREDNTVYILDGITGQSTHQINAHLSDYSQSPAIADVDQDGFGEIFLVDNLGKLKCFDHEGNPKGGFTEVTISAGQGTPQGAYAANPSFADFNGDGRVELYIGNEIYDAQTGILLSTLSNSYNKSKGAIGVNGHVFSAAYDVLPDGFCSDCSGLELICGNVVYSVNMSNGTLTEESRAPSNVNDGKVSLADWDGDDQMDIVVSGTCCGDGGVIYIWNPRTQAFVSQDAAGNPLLANPIDVQPTQATQVGLASIADFDGDGLLEIGMAGRHEFITIESDMSIKWSIPVVDQSNMTTSTAFDFEGDGSTEIVYRDENDLYILDGTTGSIISQIPCGSGTRTELPIVVDVNGDGDAELVCTCSDTPGGGKGHVRVYESDSTIWVPTRKVWNTHNYVPTFINEDLTVPIQQQNKALIEGQDLYLAQTPLTYRTGNPVYPVLPDYTISLDSVVKDCSAETNTAYVKICMQTPDALVFDFDLSYYHDDPTAGGTLITSQRIDHDASSIPSTGCLSVSSPIDFGNYDLHVYVNDQGTDPSKAPLVLMPECDTSNNLVTVSLTDCSVPNLIISDTLKICKGDSLRIEAVIGDAFTWRGSTLFSQVNDSVIKVAPAATSSYQVTSLFKNQNLIVNSDFEANNTGGNVLIFLDASAVPGWSTSDSQNEIEIWSSTSGTTAYTGNQFIELNANDDAALFQDITTVPGSKLLWSFAHRGRNGVDQMSFSVGPPGGPLSAIGNFSDGGAVWGLHSGVYEIPSGQTTTRFYFTAVTGGASGNFLDAIQFNSFNEQEDSVVVIVEECMSSCQTPLTGVVNARIAAWQYIGPVSQGLNYELEAISGSKNFTATNGPQVGEQVFSVVYNRATGYSVSLERVRYKGNNRYHDNFAGMNYDASPHGWTGLSGIGQERAPVLGYMAFIDANGNGAYDSGIDYFYRDLHTLSIDAAMTGDLYMAFYDDGVYSDNLSEITVSATATNCPTDLEVSKTDGVPSYQRSSNTVYTIVAKNNGPHKVDGAQIYDPIPSGVNGFNWTAAFYGTSSNSSGTSGSGALVDEVNLAVGDSIVYTVTAAVSGAKYGDLINTVSINTPAGTFDTDSTNNIATDIDSDPDPTSCFIMMTDFEDYVNCTAPSYDAFTQAYTGNSAWVNSNHTAGIFIHDPGNCTNIPNGHLQPDADGGTAYAGLHSPLNGNIQEVIIGTLPTSLLANQEYEISFIGVSLLVRNQVIWDEYGEVDFFGIEEGSNPALNATTQANWNSISAIPEVDHLGTSATVSSRNQWNEYSFKFTPSRNYDRLLLAPRGNYAYVGIDNIIVKVATQIIDVDSVTICQGTDEAVFPYAVVSGSADEFALDWDDALNTAGVLDLSQGIFPNSNEFVQQGLEDLPAGVYIGELRTYNTLLGCEGVDTIVLTIAPRVDVLLPNDTSICLGDSVVLSAGNVPDLLISWSGGENSQTITVDSTGLYQLTGTNVFGCSDSDSVMITVNPLPQVYLGPDSLICSGDSVALDAQNLGAVHLWNTSAIFQTISINQTGEYDVIVTDSNGCVGKDTMNLLVAPLPVVDLGNDTSLCMPDSLVLDAGIWPTVWWHDGGSSPLFKSKVSVLAYVEIKDVNGCEGSDTLRLTVNPLPEVSLFDSTICAGDTVLLDAQYPSASHEWNTGGVYPSDQYTQYLTVVDSGIYGVEVTDTNGCVGSDSMTLYVDTLPLVHLRDTIICDGEEVEVDAGQWSSYLWSDNSTGSSIMVTNSSTSYVDILDGNGCPGQDTITVTVNPIPIVDLGEDTTLCVGSTLLLDAGNPRLYFLWGDGVITQTNQGSVGLNTVTVQDDIGCAQSDTLVIELETIYDPFIKKEYKFCEGTTAELLADSNLMGYRVTWPGLSNSDTHVISETGTYQSEVFGTYCSALFDLRGIKIDTQEVYIEQMSVLDQYCFDYDVVTLEAMGQDSDVSLLWSTGDTTSSIEVNQVGVYSVVTSNQICGSRTSTDIEEFCPGLFFVPNAFTPNGDGLNDLFFTVNKRLLDFQMDIYDRWGLRLYSTDDPTAGWDGTYKGSPVQMDVYVYKVSYQYFKDKGEDLIKKIVGTVTLIR